MIETPIQQYCPQIGKAEANACYDYLTNGGWLTEFKKTSEFEEKICTFTGAKYCIVTTSGTVALMLSLMAIGLKDQDEVLVPDLTMIATPNVVRFLSARVVLVDVEPKTLCMDVDLIKKKITKKTKALIYVSLNGRCGEIEEIKKVCNHHGIMLIEDAAQSLGSYHNGVHLGRYGELGCFSFSMPKIITTGQGGAIIFDDSRYAQRIKKLKDFGRDQGGNDVHNDMGYNFKFTDIQATLGIVQLEKILKKIAAKKKIYSFYEKNLSMVPDVAFLPTNLEQVTPWFVDIYVENREKLMAYLHKNSIQTRPIYPPIHSQKIYKTNKLFDVSTHFSKQGLWLPSDMSLRDGQLEKICEKIQSFYNRKGAHS